MRAGDGGDDSEGCGICDAEVDLGAYLGEFQADTSGDVEASVWQYEQGSVLFVWGTGRISFDASRPMVYCETCEQDFREDHGIAETAPLAAHYV